MEAGAGHVGDYIDEVASRALAELQPTPSETPQTRFQGHIEQAAGVARIDVLPRNTRLRFIKRSILRVTRLFTSRQTAFNVNCVAALGELATAASSVTDSTAGLRTQLFGLRQELGAITARLETMNDDGLDKIRREVRQRVAGFEASLATTNLALDETLVSSQEVATRLEEQLREYDEALTKVQARFFDVEQARAKDRTELRQQQGQLDMLLREIRSRLPDPPDPATLLELASEAADDRLSELYAEFEDVFRGSRSEIAQRQKIYLDVLSGTRPQGPVIDLGCGRGEWLELLQGQAIPAYGIDTNESVLQAARDRGLDVRRGDALVHLEGLPKASVRAITAFHFAEHISLSNLLALLDTSLMALRHGGVLLLETPNPTNLVVGAASFYLDPTHLRPLHPQFLEFLFKVRGFVDVEVRYVNPASEPPLVAPTLDSEAQTDVVERIVSQLNWMLFGPQDYAVIGRKASLGQT